MSNKKYIVVQSVCCQFQSKYPKTLDIFQFCSVSCSFTQMFQNVFLNSKLRFDYNKSRTIEKMKRKANICPACSGFSQNRISEINCGLLYDMNHVIDNYQYLQRRQQPLSRLGQKNAEKRGCRPIILCCHGENTKVNYFS